MPLVAMQQPHRDEAGQGIRILPADTGSRAAALLRPCTLWQQPTDMAEAAGNENRGNLARRAMWGARLQVKELGVLGSPPLAVWRSALTSLRRPRAR